MLEGPLDEGEALLRVRAAEAVKAEFENTWVGASLSDENRSFEPWVIQARASQVTLPFGLLAFARLNQRPTSPLGQMGVEVGHLVIGRMCPGMIRGMFHVAGDERLESWAVEHQAKLVIFFRNEIRKVNREIEERDIVHALGTAKPNEEQIDAIIGHLQDYGLTLDDWVTKLEAGDLKLVPVNGGA